MTPRAQKDKRPPPKPPTADDAWQQHVKTTCAKAAVEWLRGTVNTQRAINSLSKAEVEALCECVTSAWIVEQSKRVQAPDTPADEAEYLRFLLM